MVKRFNWLVFCLLFSVGMMAKSGGRQYNSYKGLVMAGYQGWFNAPGDGSHGRGWHHYKGSNGFQVPVLFCGFLAGRCRNIRNFIRRSLLLQTANRHLFSLLMTSLRLIFILNG